MSSDNHDAQNDAVICHNCHNRCWCERGMAEKHLELRLCVNEMHTQIEENRAQMKENGVRMKVNGRWIKGYLSC